MQVYTNEQSLYEVIQTLYGTTVYEKKHVAGGCINNAQVIRLADGQQLFLKENSKALTKLFAEEAKGLLALAESGHVRVPEPIAVFFSGKKQYLLLEYIESRVQAADFFECFAQGLAALHRDQREDRCGFSSWNYLGSTVQKNDWSTDWYTFFGEQRLGFQMELARRNGYGNKSMEQSMHNLIKRLPEILPRPDDEQTSLLHGDLWGGNYMTNSEGEFVLIDPAVYYGHRETDIAMTMLFGGFPHSFYDAYDSTWHMTNGWRQRMDIYNLYHLLNHLNLFGMSYAAQCHAILQRFSS